MAHTYVIQKQEFQPPGTTGPTAGNPNPAVKITGTVDGVPVVVNTTFSAINQPTAIAYQNAVTPLMLDAFLPYSTPATQNPPTSSWTQ